MAGSDVDDELAEAAAMAIIKQCIVAIGKLKRNKS